MAYIPPFLLVLADRAADAESNDYEGDKPDREPDLESEFLGYGMWDADFGEGVGVVGKGDGGTDGNVWFAAIEGGRDKVEGQVGGGVGVVARMTEKVFFQHVDVDIAF